MHEDFAQAAAALQDGVGPVAPVVEVAGHDQWRIGRHFGVHELAQQFELAPAVRFLQAEVHADGVDALLAPGHAQRAVQQAAALGAGDGDVVVLIVLDRELRQHRVAVVAMGVHRVAAIGELGPDLVGEELVVRVFGEVQELRRVFLVRALHLLQEDHVGADRAHGLAQLMQDELAVEEGEALVGVDRHHLEGELGHGAVGRVAGHARFCTVRPGEGL